MKRLVCVLIAAALLPFAQNSLKAGPPANHRFKIRTITAGVNLKNTRDLSPIETAIAFLERSKKKFEDAGYEIQTLRITTQPFPNYLGGKNKNDTFDDLKALDRLASEKHVSLNIGPVIVDNRHDPDFAQWATRLIKETNRINFSVAVASPGAVHDQTALTAAEAIVAIAKSTAGGRGNFRFTASANCPPGNPFFPAGYHEGPPDFSIGLETPLLLKDAFEKAEGIDDGKRRLKATLESELTPIEKLASSIASAERRAYLGIDVSPAPSKDASIGAAIEALTHSPFGSSSTLSACAAITDVLHNLNIKRCGYSGLMLPVLEDPVLAARANEGRYSVRELLLYSSVCGTGLDVVPLPGESTASELAALIRDVAALSVKLHKPLSARLFPVPGKKAGELAEFNDPLLVDCNVMKLD